MAWLLKPVILKRERRKRRGGRVDHVDEGISNKHEMHHSGRMIHWLAVTEERESRVLAVGGWVGGC